jgi:hypothetical protein
MKVKQDTLKKAMESKDLTLSHEERVSKAADDARLNLTQA